MGSRFVRHLLAWGEPEGSLIRERGLRCTSITLRRYFADRRMDVYLSKLVPQLGRNGCRPGSAHYSTYELNLLAKIFRT